MTKISLRKNRSSVSQCQNTIKSEISVRNVNVTVTQPSYFPFSVVRAQSIFSFTFVAVNDIF